MANFNRRKASKSEAKTINKAGGQAFVQTSEMEFVSMLVTSFAADKFYEKADETFERIKSAMSKIDPLFAAKAAVFARRKYGMRSISHFAAAMLAPHLTGKDWGADFYNAVVNRPDDMLEIAAIFMANGGKFPNSLKRGFSKAIGRFDSYQLAKYRGEGKGIKLVDIVNLVHPKPNERNEAALKNLVAGNLKNEATWEAMLSKAGQGEDAEASKAEAWEALINSGKMPYFALLRNLRNILQQNPKLTGRVCELLCDEKAIKRSLVLPFRYPTAFAEIQKLPQDKNTRLVLEAIAKALDISCSNVPDFDGDTLAVVDVSGSMGDKDDNKSPAGIAGLFAAVMCRAMKCDLMFFDDSARYQNYDPTDSAMSIFGKFRFSAGGTNFHSIFQTAKKAYDRVIILSDMQGWIGGYTPTAAFSAYKSKYKCEPFVYSFDLQGYGTLQFPENKVFCLAGFSDKVFDTMALLEKDKFALLNEIQAIDFSEF